MVISLCEAWNFKDFKPETKNAENVPADAARQDETFILDKK